MSNGTIAKFTLIALAVSGWHFVGAQDKPAQAPAAAAPAAAAAPSQDGVPPDAKPGECYARIYTPPELKTVTEKVERKPASKKIQIIPAKFAPSEEKVMVKPASKKLELVPAQYDNVEEKVEVKPASVKVEHIPAVYENVTEKVMVKPAYTTWKKGSGGVSAIQSRRDAKSGDIMCLVEVPAEYANVTKKVLKTPASTREVQVPAVYKTLKKTVMKTPPSTREIEVPAEYKTVQVMKEVEPAKTVEVEVPAEYESVTKTTKVSEAKVDWRSIRCDTNLTKAKTEEIQRALSKAGFDQRCDRTEDHVGGARVPKGQRLAGGRLPESRYGQGAGRYAELGASRRAIAVRIQQG
jgi:hypothetical protein